MKNPLAIAAFLAVSSLLFACSGGTSSTGDGTPTKSGDKTDKTTDQSPTEKKPAGKSSGDTSTEESCQSSSLNGRCTAGPKKGASCCYAPSSEDDPACPSSEDCDNVCRYCK